jgi:hypothetical protein
MLKGEVNMSRSLYYNGDGKERCSCGCDGSWLYGCYHSLNFPSEMEILMYCESELTEEINDKLESINFEELEESKIDNIIEDLKSEYLTRKFINELNDIPKTIEMENRGKSIEECLKMMEDCEISKLRIYYIQVKMLINSY